MTAARPIASSTHCHPKAETGRFLLLACAPYLKSSFAPGLPEPISIANLKKTENEMLQPAILDPWASHAE